MPIRTFWRVLGFIYFVAFVSFGNQSAGLIGSHGILPFPYYLRYFRTQFGVAAFHYVPTLLWVSPTDSALTAIWILGALSSLLLILCKWPRIALAVCLILWLSICSVGQDFLGFQWDALLVETGFLALFTNLSPIRIGLFRWLLFRLMFFSGVVKLASRDESWRNLSALHFHYLTQPLPTPLAWYLYQLPMWFHRASTALVLLAELLVPFLYFLPSRERRIGAWITIALQCLILATGNYTFFNILAIALTLWLFVEPQGSGTRRQQAVSIALALFIGLVSALLLLQLFPVNLPPGGSQILHAVAPFQLVNSYGLFAVMTTQRDEIIVEGSADGASWRAYEFKYKPGDLMRPPPLIAPFQPRLDWQMWFAALGDYQQNRWFVNFMLRLLHGEPAVLRLLQYNPFPDHPPKYVRARLFTYDFTRYGQSGWWTRKEKREYFPAVSLK